MAVQTPAREKKGNWDENLDKPQKAPTTKPLLVRYLSYIQKIREKLFIESVFQENRMTLPSHFTEGVFRSTLPFRQAFPLELLQEQSLPRLTWEIVWVSLATTSDTDGSEMSAVHPARFLFMVVTPRRLCPSREHAVAHT